MSDEESGEVEIQESRTPKMNKFVHDLCDWMLLATLVFVVAYGILYLFYEIALGMAHIRWLYNTFLMLCIFDMVMYLIVRFAVVGGETNRCLVYLGLIVFIADFLINVITPAIVLISYELTLEHPSTGGLSEYDHGDTPPQDCQVDSSGFKCGVVKSIRTSVWCMYILLLPRPLLIYGILSILRRSKKSY